MAPTRSQLLRHAADRASRDDFFLGNVLTEYMVARGLNRAGLSKQLSCSETQLSLLALCRLPKESGVTFRAEVEKIAAYVGIDPLELGQVIREVQSRRALQTSGQTSYTDPGLLLAARDNFAEVQRPRKRKRSDARKKPKRGRK